MKSIEYPFVSLRVTEPARLCLGLLLMLLGAAVSGQVGDTYRIRPTDILIVDVVNERELTAKEFRVSAAGEISYPFIGAFKVADLTPMEVQEGLKRLLEADYLVNAQVLVQVKEFRKQLISVFGQVNRPGLIEIPPERRMTVIEAITAANGLTRLARPSGIQLNRKGRTEPFIFSIDDLKNPEKVFYVEPEDVIFVPESRF